MNGPRNYHTKRSKSNRESYISYESTNMWNQIEMIQRNAQTGVPTVAQQYGWCLCNGTDVGSIPGAAEWVKDPVLPQLWLQLLLRFNPWPGNSICLQLQPKQDKKILQNRRNRRSRCGAVETNLTRNCEVVGSIPGLAHWVKDLALP